MATRKPSIRTQLKAAQAVIAERDQELRARQKELDTTKQMRDHYDNRVKAAEGEIAQIHAFLDAVPNPPAAMTGEYGAKVGAMTRLAVFLSTRTGGMTPCN